MSTCVFLCRYSSYADLALCPSPTESPELSITKAEAVGKSRIFLSWAVSDGNSAITAYRLQYMLIGSDQWRYWSRPVSVNATSAVLTGLDSTRGYRVRLTAENAIGSSVPVEAGQDGQLITQDHGEFFWTGCGDDAKG